MSAMEIKQRNCIGLTIWMGFHAGNVSNVNQVKELHRTHSLDRVSCRKCQQWKSSKGAAHNLLSGWDFMQAVSAIGIKQRSCTGLAFWVGFHAGSVSNRNQAKELHRTHFLDINLQCQL